MTPIGRRVLTVILATVITYCVCFGILYALKPPFVTKKQKQPAPPTPSPKRCAQWAAAATAVALMLMIVTTVIGTGKCVSKVMGKPMGEVLSWGARRLKDVVVAVAK